VPPGIFQPEGAFTRAWRALYEAVYFAIESGTRLLCRPLFLVRRVGRAPVLPAGGVLLCPNHQSYLDPPLVQLVVPRRVTFVMTNDFYRSRVGNWFFRLVGALPVGAGADARVTLRRASALLRTGAAVVMFPEGRLSPDGNLQRPQRGVAVLARRTGVPVIPVAIEGSHRAWAKGARWGRRGDVRIAFGEPLVWSGPGGRQAEQAFADGLMAAIADTRASIPRRPR
jgi:1-acyl-sn-glycerol-3-phosphate acyltransferase